MKSSSQYQEHSNWPTTLKGIDKKKNKHLEANLAAIFKKKKAAILYFHLFLYLFHDRIAIEKPAGDYTRHEIYLRLHFGSFVLSAEL